LISGRKRRRQWSGEDRARILAAISAPGAVVAEIARREDVCTSLVYKRRRERRRVAKMVEFAPVVVEPPPGPPSGSVEERGDRQGTASERAHDFIVELPIKAEAKSRGCRRAVSLLGCVGDIGCVTLEALRV
jgi:transposase-like protein